MTLGGLTAVDGALRFVKGTAAYAAGYDPNGNMTRWVRRHPQDVSTYRCTNDKGSVFSWDQENRLIGIAQSTGTVATFVYDGDGNRVKATEGGVTTAYLGDYWELAGGTLRKYYYHAGRRIAMRVGSTLYWLLSDHLGSSSVAYKDSDSTTVTQRYWAWGAIRSTSGTMPTDYGFTGQRLDAYINLYQMGSRG